MENNDKIEIFLKWLKINGALIDNLEFPVYFKKKYFDIQGVSVKKDIQPYEAICAIPNKLLLSIDKLNDNEYLMKIVKENPFLFEENKNENYDFNKHLLLLLFEKNKGDKSFFYPYLNLIDTESPISWNKEIINTTSELKLYQEINENIKFIFNEYIIFKKIFEKYEGFENIDIKTYIWCNENISTRVFGWFIPFNILAPMIDFVNHYNNPNCSTEYFSFKNIIEKKFIPKNENGYFYDFRFILEDYIKFNNLNNIDIDKNLNKNKFKKRKSLVFIEKNKSFLNENDINDLKKYENKRLPFKIKINKISKIINDKIKNENKNIWEFSNYFESDKEDNDSESEVDENKEESENKEEKDEKDDEEEEEEKDDKEKEDEEKNNKYKFSLKNKDENYFVLVNETNYVIKKGKELKLTYGSRNNFFLLLWYGFSLSKNKYDSLKFRLKMENKSNLYNFEKNIYDYIIIDSISSEDICSGFLNTYDGMKINIKNISKEFKWKYNIINYDLIKFIRVYLSILYNYNNEKTEIEDYSIIKALEIEIKIIQKYEEIVLFLKLKYKNSIEKINSFLEDKNIDIRKKFIFMYEKNMRKIAEEQLKLCGIIKDILLKRKKYYEINNNYENNDNEMIIKRLKMKNYLKDIQDLINL